MEIKTDYRLKIVITPKPLIWEDIYNVRYFKNPITGKSYGQVYMTYTNNGRVIYLCSKGNNDEEETIHSTFIQACSKMFELWHAEIEAKIAELATLSIEIK